MQYALLGDLHSNIEDTRAVLAHIQETAKDAIIIGLGDLYECTVSKKKAQIVSGLSLQKAAIVNNDFENLLTFPSIRGNQEERITRVTGIERFTKLPETMEIEGAVLMHGHQFKWSVSWQPTFPSFKKNHSFSLDIAMNLVFIMAIKNYLFEFALVNLSCYRISNMASMLALLLIIVSGVSMTAKNEQ